MSTTLFETCRGLY